MQAVFPMWNVIEDDFRVDLGACALHSVGNFLSCETSGINHNS